MTPKQLEKMEGDPRYTTQEELLMAVATASRIEALEDAAKQFDTSVQKSWSPEQIASAIRSIK